MAALPRYRTDPSPRALATRLRALTTASVPVACGVYAGLATPTSSSPVHAWATYEMARAFVARVVAPPFESPPSSQLRLLTAASWDRLDGAGADMTSFPLDLASNLWWRVQSRTLDSLEVGERRLGADLLLRLGYPQHAAQLIGLSIADPHKHRFSPDFALAQLAVLRCHLPASAVETLALNSARDVLLPAPVRRDLALFVVFLNAARRTDTTSLQAAAALAVNAAVSLPQSGAAAALARVRLYRGIAVIPLLRRDVRETHRLLGRALECLRSVPAAPGELERLSLIDHSYALYLDLVRTHLAFGMAQRAVAASEELVSLSPCDDRTWASRGDALVAADRLDEAVAAYGRGVALGGWGAARAAFCQAVVLERLGMDDDAAASFDLARRIDPTALVDSGPAGSASARSESGREEFVRTPEEQPPRQRDASPPVREHLTAR